MVNIRDGIKGVTDGLEDPLNMDENALIRLQGLLNSERSVAGQNGLSRKRVRNLLADLNGCEELRGQQILAVDDAPPALFNTMLSYIVAATRRRFHFLPYKRGGVEEFGDEVLGHLEEYSIGLVLMDENLFDPEADTTIYGSDVARYCLKKKPDLPPIIGFTTDQKRAVKFFGKWLVLKDFPHPKELVHRLAELLAHIHRTRNA
ncbi:hypothetical protein KJ996_02840 [Patescibacteria group bacterium]|nr:hypothetical protein [Patescibacteria group bacterium]